MKKLLSMAVIAAIGTVSYGADTLEEAFSSGKLSGQVRVFYIDRDYDGGVTLHRSAIAAGGHLKYETAPYYGFSLGTAFYTTNGFGIGSDNLPGASLDPTLFGENEEGYTILGEAYLKYTYKNSAFKAGRQRLDTPMAGSDDARMIPNLFEAYLFTNTDLKDTTLIAAHVTKFAAGTFSNAYKDFTETKNESDKALALTAGYGANNKSGEFIDMGEYAIGKETDGVSIAAVKYSGVKNLTLQAWDYYAHDIMNIVYLQGDYAIPIGSVKMKTSLQYIHESDTGDSLAGDFDSDYIGAKVGAKVGNVSGYVAYSTTGSDSNNPLGSSIASPWGGMPAFTQGMVTRHQFFADTDAWKVAGNYNFQNMGINANATLYYCNFDVGENNPYDTGKAWTAKESGFDIKYYPKGIQNLQLRFRGNFPRDFKPGIDWDEYRFIVNYNF
ncbi:OprD family outer membrane porin [Hydrogenimonas thermophila]|uniref:Outer membrane porin, OprD family n=1 Tax=Hydrogenimonas thermophila TaxID=223786 RepID=A0A1I5LZQ7_9BACT|nr:OprD family outer membrane porin [Hydrogenimonas thermophila]WOE70517.1 OprD family outer membrane porin [Hydrogenimonas thermophila]WOE73033.1 OprD family outer membrane porin [Hydrogenimonas thermophila]SFP02752.1 outer membrane porin, OprD family [Hydrogenimonas thermophila]